MVSVRRGKLRFTSVIPTRIRIQPQPAREIEPGAPGTHRRDAYDTLDFYWLARKEEI